jgi:FlaA1/EpsC-like NDP-sugar epimerase
MERRIEGRKDQAKQAGTPMSILEGSNILITGGTGSFGQKCAEYLLTHEAAGGV